MGMQYRICTNSSFVPVVVNYFSDKKSKNTNVDRFKKMSALMDQPFVKNLKKSLCSLNLSTYVRMIPARAPGGPQHRGRR